MKNLIMAKEGEDSFVRWIKKRVDNNLNFLALFSGPTGVGKSYSALSVATQIDSEFNPKEQVAFNFKQLMKIINKFNGVNKEEDYAQLHKRKYKVIIFDEAQTDLSNRDWQSKVNKLFNYLLSTFRHQNIIVLFTSPYSDFLDSASMKLLHANFECKGWNKNTCKSHIRPKLLQYNAKMKKFYEHSLHVISNGKANKLVNWFVNKPSDAVVIPYEEMKTAFTNELNRKITQELEDIDKPEQDDKEPVKRKPLTDSQLRVMQTLANVNGPDRYKQASAKLGIAMSSIHQNKILAEKKGYSVEEFKVLEDSNGI